MATRGELIIQAVIAAVSSVYQLSGRVYRDKQTVLDKGALPAAVVREEAEDPPVIKNVVADRTMTLAIDLIATGDSGRTSIDTARAQLHRTVWNDPSFGALALGFDEAGSEWNDEYAEQSVYALTVRYRVSYRTMADDLELVG